MLTRYIFLLKSRSFFHDHQRSSAQLHILRPNFTSGAIGAAEAASVVNVIAIAASSCVMTRNNVSEILN